MGATHPVGRSFLRHPADIPIEIFADGVRQRAARRMKDVGLGGLACRSENALEIGAGVVITIGLVQPPFRAPGTVVWCARQGMHYEIGIRFLEADDAFAARMVEQICHIEHYRNEVLRIEGRVLDGESAALEWIERFAGDFPSLENYRSH